MKFQRRSSRHYGCASGATTVVLLVLTCSLRALEATVSENQATPYQHRENDFDDLLLSPAAQRELTNEKNGRSQTTDMRHRLLGLSNSPVAPSSEYADDALQRTDPSGEYSDSYSNKDGIDDLEDDESSSELREPSSEKKNSAMRYIGLGKKSNAMRYVGLGKKNAAMKFVGLGKKSSAMKYVGLGKRNSAMRYVGLGKKSSAMKYVGLGKKSSAMKYVGLGKRDSAMRFVGLGKRNAAMKYVGLGKKSSAMKYVGLGKREEWSPNKAEMEGDKTGSDVIDMSSSQDRSSSASGVSKNKRSARSRREKLRRSAGVASVDPALLMMGLGRK